MKRLILIFALLLLTAGCVEKTTVETKYVCPDNSIVSNPDLCQRIEKTKTVTKYVCPNGKVVEDPQNCPTTTQTTLSSTTSSTATTSTTTTTEKTITVTIITEKTTTTRETTTSTTATTETTTTTLHNDCVDLGCDTDTKYVGSKNSDKYHHCDCSYARGIKKENIVCFRSVEEAEERGYIPCSRCNP